MGVDYRQQYRPDQLEPFFPHEIIKMAVVVLCTLAVIMLLVILPILLEHLGLTGVFHEEQPADPRSTPAHIRPEWYFLATYQYLKLMPQEFLGIDGKAMGMFTQGVGVLMLLLVPFWFPLTPAGLDFKGWRKGLTAFGLMLAIFAVPAAILGLIRANLPDPYRDVIHPMFVWPPGAVVAYVAAGLLAKRAGIEDAFGWLKLFTSGLLLVGFQFMVFVAVFGQALAGAIPPAIGYGLGGIAFLAASGLIVRLVALRAAGEDERWRWKALVAFVTESLLLFVGLTVWALWPAGSGQSHGGGDSEMKGFLFTVSMIATATVVFFALIAAERRAIRRTLGPPEER